MKLPGLLLLVAGALTIYWANRGIGSASSPTGQQNQAQPTTGADGKPTILANPSDPTNLFGRGQLPSITPNPS